MQQSSGRGDCPSPTFQLVSAAVLDGAISLYQFLEGLLWPTGHADTVVQRLIRGNYKAFMIER